MSRLETDGCAGEFLSWNGNAFFIARCMAISTHSYPLNKVPSRWSSEALADWLKASGAHNSSTKVAKRSFMLSPEVRCEGILDGENEKRQGSCE